jgi:hypothetical protein
VQEVKRCKAQHACNEKLRVPSWPVTPSGQAPREVTGAEIFSPPQIATAVDRGCSDGLGGGGGGVAVDRGLSNGLEEVGGRAAGGLNGRGETAVARREQGPNEVLGFYNAETGRFRPLVPSAVKEALCEVTGVDMNAAGVCHSLPWKPANHRYSACVYSAALCGGAFCLQVVAIRAHFMPNPVSR